MTREDAINTIYLVINSGIIEEELEKRLSEVAECICHDNFTPCVGTEYCSECNFVQK